MARSDAHFIREGRRRSAPPVLEIHEAIRSEGEHELSRPVLALGVSALAAGLSMGFSFLAEGALELALPDADWTTLISKLGYAVGFLFVILGRQQLFTENTLTPILAFFTRPSRECFFKLGRLWAVVLWGNVLGAALFAAFLAFTPIFEAPLNSVLETLSAKPFKVGALATFLRAILGGWLIALMVWLLPFAEAARFFVIVTVTYLVGIGHLAHIIAGSVVAFYAIFAGLATLGQLAFDFWLPALLGNVVGGVAFVAMLHHAQVHFDQKTEEESQQSAEEKNGLETVTNPFGPNVTLDDHYGETEETRGDTSDSPGVGLVGWQHARPDGT